MLMLAVSSLLVAVAAGVDEGQRVSESAARTLFAEYQLRSRSSDPAEADLHCDDGRIVMFREDSAGAVTKIEGPAPGYKQILRESAEQGRLAGDYSTFSDISFQEIGLNVQVSATRYSAARKYESPAVFLIGKCGNGEVGIMEMTIHTKPGPK